MITVDSILHAFTIPMAIAGWLALYSVTAYADAPSPETFNNPSELVLTLSDQWLQPEKQSTFKAPMGREANQIIADKIKKNPVKMDCGMDVNQYAYADNSITSRLSGECDLKYNY